MIYAMGSFRFSNQPQPDPSHDKHDRLVDLLAFSGHEINNVLTRLLLNIEWLSRDSDPHLNDRRQKVIRNLNENAVMLRSIARSYIALARVQDQSSVTNMVPLDPVSQLLEPVAACYAETLAQQELTLEIGSSDAIGLSICADHALMTSVFDNLLNNAIKYAEPGSHIQITLAQVRGRLEISFKNQAKDVNPEMIEYLFDRFSRGSNIENKSGSGIGLYLVRQVVEAHGGTVRAEAVPCSDVVFTVSLPAFIV